MKRYILLIIAALSFCSCAEFDDSSIWDELKEHEDRISALESLCKDMNADLASIAEILGALQDNDYVTGTTPLAEGGEVVGYIIHFSKGGSVTIYHGKDGNDGHSPDVGIRKAADGRYYWTSDGEWMTDEEGDMIPAVVTNPDGGYIVPQFRVSGGIWYISYDDGNTWREIGNMPGWNSSSSIFSGVNVSDPYCVVLTLSDGQQIRIPTWRAFNELEILAKDINSSIASLQSVIEALQTNDYVTGIVPMTEDGKEIGYTIYFSKRDPINILHGNDGAVPSVGAVKGDDGLYYWTVDGKWMLDGEGNRIPCTGQSGQDGDDGVVPRLKIEEGYWYVSYDGGNTWEEEPLGTVASFSSALIFADVTYDSDHVYITMSDGEEIVLPRHSIGLLDFISLDPMRVEGTTVTFSGYFDIPKEDLPYTRLTLLYTEDLKDFNVHTATEIHASLSDVTDRFSLSLFDLKYNANYRYCFRLKMRSGEYYSEVSQVTTEEFGLGKDIYLHYYTGKFTGSGYYYTTTTSSIINGFGTPLLKSHMPESIDAIQFYVKGKDEEIQPLTAFIGYLTDPENISTFKIIRSCTNNVKMTTSFSKITLPLAVTREELSEVPDDGVLMVGYYPPPEYGNKPIGCGYYNKSEPCFAETEGHKGVYYYKNVKKGTFVWAISSQKNPRYAALVSLVPTDTTDN